MSAVRVVSRAVIAGCSCGEGFAASGDEAQGEYQDWLKAHDHPEWRRRPGTIRVTYSHDVEAPPRAFDRDYPGTEAEGRPERTGPSAASTQDTRTHG